MDEVVAYLNRLIDLMGLSDWEIVVDTNAAPEDYASVKVTEGQRRATLSLDPKWEGFKRVELRWVLVHELVHLHLSRMKVGVDHYLNLLPDDVKAVSRLALDSEAEYAVDAIATAWARRLPLLRQHSNE